jgi:hypothetical protein
MMSWTALVLASTALLGTDGVHLPLPAVQVLEGPPPGNYCGATSAQALFDVNTRVGDLYYAQGTFKVDGKIIYVSDVAFFFFAAGVQTAPFPLPREVLPDSAYTTGTVFSITSRYFDAAMGPTYENEIAIVCDTGETLLLRNSNLDSLFASGFE